MTEHWSNKMLHVDLNVYAGRIYHSLNGYHPTETPTSKDSNSIQSKKLGSPNKTAIGEIALL